MLAAYLHITKVPIRRIFENFEGEGKEMFHQSLKMPEKAREASEFSNHCTSPSDLPLAAQAQ